MANEEGSKKPKVPAAALAFGNRLRQRAHALGLSSADVARRVGISDQRYANYANGTRKAPLEMLRKLSAVLEITVDELLAPTWPLLHTDRDAYIAANRLAEYWPNLTREEAQTLASMASYMTAERRNDWDAPLGMPPSMHRVARIHERVIPSIIRTHRPLAIATCTAFGQDGTSAGATVTISMEFPSDTPRKKLEAALLSLTKERLRGIPFDVRLVQHVEHKTCLLIEMVLGPVSASKG